MSWKDNFNLFKKTKKKIKKPSSVPIKCQITKIDKDGNETVQIISCKI